MHSVKELRKKLKETDDAMKERLSPKCPIYR